MTTTMTGTKFVLERFPETDGTHHTHHDKIGVWQSGISSNRKTPKIKLVSVIVAARSGFIAGAGIGNARLSTGLLRTETPTMRGTFAMESPRLITTPCMKSRVGAARFVEIGKKFSTSITVTAPKRSEACFVETAIEPSDSSNTSRCFFSRLGDIFGRES
jgi:hypothetical protein